jgi:hypothetical protein
MTRMRKRSNEILASLAMVAVGTVVGAIVGGAIIARIAQALLSVIGIEWTRRVEQPVSLLSFIAGSLIGAYLSSVRASRFRRRLESSRKPASDTRKMWWDEPDDEPSGP